ncbi:hypothetical protein PoB_003697600, partial [Plakobranchus ocellatus]
FLCVSRRGHYVEDSGLNSKHGCVVSHHAWSFCSAKNLRTKMRPEFCFDEGQKANPPHNLISCSRIFTDSRTRLTLLLASATAPPPSLPFLSLSPDAPWTR